MVRPGDKCNVWSTVSDQVKARAQPQEPRRGTHSASVKVSVNYGARMSWGGFGIVGATRPEEMRMDENLEARRLDRA
jgi:hypothetical protein